MAIELHHLQPSHDDEMSRLKARIAELEALNHNLCERVTENDDIRLHWEEIEQTRADNERMKVRIAKLEKLNHELEEERRWRKFSEEKPNEKQWILVYYPNHSNFNSCVEVRRWDNGCKYDVDIQEMYENWMPLPSAPKEEK